MRYLILVLSLLTLPALAAKPLTPQQHYCNDPQLNQQWQQALREYPSDELLLKLSAVRTALCGMLDKGQLDLSTARSMWEKALTDALLERARAVEEKRGLMRLFGTF